METCENVCRFTAGGRTYGLVFFLKKGETEVSGEIMEARVQDLWINLSEEDGQFILEHQDEIPSEFREETFLVFLNWRNHSYPQLVAFLGWNGSCWCRQGWYWFSGKWISGFWPVCRIHA